MPNMVDPLLTIRISASKGHDPDKQKFNFHLK